MSALREMEVRELELCGVKRDDAYRVLPSRCTRAPGSRLTRPTLRDNEQGALLS